MQKTVFVVDDSDTNLSMAEEVLEAHYRVMTVPSALKMFKLLDKITPDLILLDIDMPHINGFEAIKKLKSIDAYSGIPVIFLTGRADSIVEADGFALGAADFIPKPFYAPVLLNRVKMHIDINMLLRDQTAQLRRVQNGIISVLADMINARDKTTGGHIYRTTLYVKILMDSMLINDIYTDEMRGWDMEVTVASAALHDIGKVTISDLILNKPGKFTLEEREIMTTHVMEGVKIIDQIISKTGEDAFLYNAKQFASYHHERWDGNGYPYGLSEIGIPLHGRIMAIADVYDSLVSMRPYKTPLLDEEAVDIIMNDSGKHFDPKITQAFFAVKNRFKNARADLCQ